MVYKYKNTFVFVILLSLLQPVRGWLRQQAEKTTLHWLICNVFPHTIAVYRPMWLFDDVDNVVLHTSGHIYNHDKTV